MPEVVTDTVRLNQIAAAVIAGVSKRDFKPRSKDEAYTFDRIVADVLDIRARGGTPVLPREVPG